MIPCGHRSWEQKVFTGVPGTGFSSATLQNYRGYFNKQTSDGIAVHVGSIANKTDGDISGNKSLSEDSYRSNIDYTSINSNAYRGANVSQVEHLNSLYSDLTTDLLQNKEKENDWKQMGNDVVAAGHANTEAATLDVLKSAIQEITDIPTSAIRIDNYTVSNFYLEQVMSNSVAKDIQQAYTDAKQAGFLASFQARTPLKVSRLTMGPGLRSLDAGNLRGWASTSKPVTSEDTTGMTSVTNAMAFKDSAAEGTTSTLTGLKFKAYAGFISIGHWLAQKTGTQKIYAKAMTWFSGLSTKGQAAVLIVFYLVLLGLFVGLIWVVMMLLKRVGRRMGMKRR